MLLSDVHIKQALDLGHLVIKPLNKQVQLQPCSVDLRLDSCFSFPDLDEEKVYNFEDESLKAINSIRLPSHTRVHGQTVEWLEVPDFLCGRLSTRSSLDRMGVVTNGGSTLVPAGFKGKLVLELYNYGSKDVYLPIHSRVCTITFEVLSCPASNPYSGQYQSQNSINTGALTP